jgi:hypothetical protein
MSLMLLLLLEVLLLLLVREKDRAMRMAMMDVKAVYGSDRVCILSRVSAIRNVLREGTGN